MKKFRGIFFLFGILLFFSCNNENRISISGKINNAENKTVYFQQFNCGRIETIDSAKLNAKGYFKFKTKSAHPEFYLLKLADNKIVTLLLKSGEKAIVEADYQNFTSNYSISNSPGSENIRFLNEKLQNTKTVLDSLVELYNAKKSLPGFEKQAEELEKTYLEIINSQRTFTMDFIKRNPGSLASYYALYQQIGPNNNVLDGQKDILYYRIVANSMQQEFPESQYTKALFVDLENIQKQISNAKIKKMINDAGENYPNLKLPDTNGDTVELYSFKGKCILLAFWSASDKKSVAVSEQLKKYYSTYKRKGFEIFYINVDRSTLIWQEIVEKNNYPWINVHDKDGYSAKIYNIQQLPANYLIRKDGEIVGKNLFGIYLQEKLDKYLK